MSFFPTNNPCPCESGLDYQFCCGAPNREGLNIVANIDSSGIANPTLSHPLQSALDNITTCPEFFPVKIHLFENKATLVKMTPFWFNESIFLDANRIMGSCAAQADLQWLKKVADDTSLQPMPLIFHTAFCGSTLMSRALELIFNTLPLREPDALGTLLSYSNSPNIKPEYEKQWYERILKLLSRRFEEDQVVVVKANDYANPIISKVLNYSGASRILFMYTPLREFLSGCLKAENRKQWIADRYRYILPQANKILQIPEDLHIESEDYGKMAAIYWCFNIAHFLNANANDADNIKSLEFNQMLADPMSTIKACGDWFQLELLEDVDIEHEINWLLGVYSKNAEFAYSAQTRRNEIENILGNNAIHLQQAEKTARNILTSDYPESMLPNSLI